MEMWGGGAPATDGFRWQAGNQAGVWLRMGPKEPSQSEMPVRPSRDLLERCRKGDDAAISQVYAKAFPQLVRFVMSIGAAHSDAESIAAEVLGDCLVGGEVRSVR